MSEEEAEESHLRKQVESCYQPTEVGGAGREVLSDISQVVVASLGVLKRLEPYLESTIYTDIQMQQVESALISTVQKLADPVERFTNARAATADFRSSAYAHLIT